MPSQKKKSNGQSVSSLPTTSSVLRRHASPPRRAAGTHRRGDRPAPPPPYCPQPPQGSILPAAPRLPPPSHRRTAPRHSAVEDRVPRDRRRCRCGAIPGSRRRRRRAVRGGAPRGDALAGVPGVGVVGLRSGAVAAVVLPMGRSHHADDWPLLHNARSVTFPGPC